MAQSEELVGLKGLECFMALSGFLAIALIVAIRIIRNKCNDIETLKCKLQKFETQKVKPEIPESDMEVVWNPEGGYKLVPKNMTLCCECGHNYNTAKMTRDLEGCYYCPGCASKRLQWANWAIQQLKEANEKSETVSLGGHFERPTVSGDSESQGTALGL